MVGGFTFILFTTGLTTQQVNQTFIVTIKTVVNEFFSGITSKCSSNCHLTNVTSRTLVRIKLLVRSILFVYLIIVFLMSSHASRC